MSLLAADKEKNNLNMEEKNNLNMAEAETPATASL
jgi:hypothetical protein